MQRTRPDLPATLVAVFEHLSGPSQGTVSWAGERKLNVSLRSDRLLEVSAAEPHESEAELVASLRRSNGTYEIAAAQGRSVWVNGLPVESRQLQHNDMIEFGDAGPISRVHLYRNGECRPVNLGDIFSDAAAYVRSSRRPLSRRLADVTLQILRRLARETTLLFRIGMTVALIALGIVVYQQNVINRLLRQKIETSAIQLEDFSKLLAEVRKEALTPAELGNLREELSGRMTSAAERLSKLERRSTAIERIIAKSQASVLFLQGAYGFREKATGRMLRQALGEDGQPLILPNGIPLLSLEGKGSVAERQFTGTGFVLDTEGMVATSRHVGQPWLYDVNVKAMANRGLEPTVTRFIAYYPDTADARAVTLLRASRASDLAILRLERPMPNIPGLQLASRPLRPGEEVVLIGYPTGIRSMLAQGGPALIEKLQQQNELGFWSVVAQLAAAGRIVPLASRGIVGRTSHETIVYDAETTYGGSGGPVLDINGSVVAINSAILPEYGGSNLGVPANKLRQLVVDAETR